MKARVYYDKGGEKVAFPVDERGTFNDWCDRMAPVISSGGLFIANDFAIPARNIYYIEQIEA